ncbi:hypothetical protein OHA37_26955 [Streptomyces sp. NBC_00335]|uniref:hypothetical protein n=1 Tax=unclassified Streptomyces TaxID=2593676 RepID=UPI0022504CD1|nr:MULTISPECIES: hypothetical protein [unclassified Streptomyces]MCX5407490.1 hypothetical protein [Streptomyces sp. NBC_00086]
MATATVPKATTEEAPAKPTRLRAALDTPGLYAGAALGTASALLAGDPLLYSTVGAAGVTAGWAYLGMHPGPWRWLPGQGEPWEWMCRSSRRGYRRTLRRMRRRLAAPANVPVVWPVDRQVIAWHTHPQRPALVREVTADARRARCDAFRQAWTRVLPSWKSGWWRRYSPIEMALRAGPLTAIPITGHLDMPWWAHLLIGSIAATWGKWVWRKPTPAQAPAEQQLAGEDWYLARWAEWIACDQGPLPGSKLVSVELNADRLTAVIVSTTARPAAGLDQDSVSIAFDVPPRAVNIHRPDDMAASRAKLSVRLRAVTSGLDENDLPAVWREFSPYPQSELYDAETTRFGRKFKILLPRRGTDVGQVTARAVAQALDMQGSAAEARLHLRVIDARRVEVNDMAVNPLAGGVKLDLDALIMDDQGYITIGRDLYDNPARWRLLKFDAKRRGLSGRPSASANHSFGSGTTGAGKTSLEEDLQVAQRANGFVSWLADGKGGAGYAPWMNDIDWILKSPYGAMVMAQAGTAVSEFRYAEQMKMQWLDEEGYTENGRSFFVPFEPFAPMSLTWDEFNEMILKDPQADHVKPLLSGVSSIGRLSRAAGVSARIWLQIPNLDAIGSNASANAVRDMLQSGNIALFRTARADVDAMSLGSRKPQFKLAPLPERFPDGSETGGLFYMADGTAQYTQSRVAFHSNPARLSRQYPLTSVTDREAEIAGPAYLRRAEYRHLDADGEDAFLRELAKEEHAKRPKNTTVIDTRPAPAVEDDDLDDLVPPTRSQLVWDAVDSGARRNKAIADVTGLKPTNVANATARLERLDKLRKIDRDWHTAELLDA